MSGNIDKLMKPKVLNRVITFQDFNLKDKGAVTTESVSITEPACSLDCAPVGNCFIEQLHDLDEVEEETGSGYAASAGRRRITFRQRCQCPLGRAGDRCQNGKINTGL